MDGRTNREVPPRGFSLLEVLITVVVLSLGLLGLAGLQIAGVRDTQGAYLASQAVDRAYQILDLMRANRDAARSGAYDDAFGRDTGDYCDTREPGSAEIDLCAWERALTETLPAGAGSIAVDGGAVVVCVRWAEPRRAHDIDPGACGAGGGGAPDDRRLFELRSVL